MKRIFFLVLLVLSNLSFSQTINYNREFSAQDSLFEEQLVDIAWKNYPENEEFRLLLEKSRKEVYPEQMRFTRNLRLTYNFNNKVLGDGTISQKPIFGLGVSLAIGDLLLLPNTSKQAKRDVAIAETRLNTQRLSIRSEVLKRYYTYVLALDLLKLRTASFEDAALMNKIVKEKYKGGKATLNEFNEFDAIYNNKLEDLLTQRTQLAIAKSSLEELLAMKIENIPGYKEMLEQHK
ncbi:TolC family protein [Sporocytophaga myxococcoides]|uniref:TolC family protein n=1 Tax=Sporocytophaga myxococcoides TaxID=153721 RepID=UPI00040021C8|nr:TolC family protein [Sporocytophaga myxococcoides]